VTTPWTFALLPPSWEAMLPQKFCAAMPYSADPPDAVVAPAPSHAITSSRAEVATNRARSRRRRTPNPEVIDFPSI
jgi:hypothetical protein